MTFELIEHSAVLNSLNVMKASGSLWSHGPSVKLHLDLSSLTNCKFPVLFAMLFNDLHTFYISMTVNHTVPISPGGPTLPGLPGAPFSPFSPISPVKHTHASLQSIILVHRPLFLTSYCIDKIWPLIQHPLFSTGPAINIRIIYCTVLYCTVKADTFNQSYWHYPWTLPL